MPPAPVLYNPVAAQCSLVPCLYQVAGHGNNDPAAQLSACQSVFGFPVVPTVTLPAEPILSTRTSTATHTDTVIVVTTSTAYTTVGDTSTSYETVWETATEYSTTVVKTVTTTGSASSSSPLTLKKRRGKCAPGTTSKAPSSSVLPAEPSTTTAAPTTSSALFPVPTACANAAQYSSACACLEPPAVTEDAAASTLVIDATVTNAVTVQSTSATVTTATLTSAAVKPATTTLTSTLTTETTTAATATAAPAPPQTFTLTISNGPNANKPLVASWPSPPHPLQHAPSSSTPAIEFTLPGPNTALGLVRDPALAMYVRHEGGVDADYGILFLASAAHVAAASDTWAVASCRLDADADAQTWVLRCVAPGGLSRMVQCGSMLFLAQPAAVMKGCVEVGLRV